MDINGIKYLGIDRVLKRGTGEILADLDHALLVRDHVSGACFLASEDRTTGLALLDRFAGSDCRLLMVSDHALRLAAFERYGFSEKLECWQFAYYGAKPALDARLSVKVAEEHDLPMLTRHYHMISPKELAEVVRRKSILLGYDRERLVGFIGEHLEGSMGILYVLPEYRRRGFGAALQACFMARTMDEGFSPFGQVEKDNLNSLKLQETLGMTRSDDLIVWMWK